MASSDRIPLNYLVFDDDNEAENQYNANIIIRGYNCNLIFINPQDFYCAESNIFKIEEFKDKIKEKTKDININLIISDWNILDAVEDFQGIVGWDIIEYTIEAKEKLKTRPYLIYSSDIQNASNYILGKISKEIKKVEGSDKDLESIPSLEFIKRILELKVKFCHRDAQRYSEVITLLKASSTISNIVLDSIFKYGENIVYTGNQYYDGRKISDLVDGPTPNDKGLKFIREFIDLSIANYTEIINR
ncbi:hypothetical protein ACYSNM_13500 [Myroides sp. LJL116]